MKKMILLTVLSFTIGTAALAASGIKLKVNAESQVCTIAALNDQVVFSCDNVETQTISLPGVDYTRTASAAVAELIGAGFKVSSCMNQAQLLEANITCVMTR